MRTKNNTRAVCDAAVALIKRHEGYSATPYLCPAGYWTIGYGHLIPAGQEYTTVDAATADTLLRADLRVAAAAVARYITVPLTDNQFGALVSFTFNLGAGALQSATLRRVINRGEHSDAPAQLQRWVYAGKPPRKLRGLIARRADEAALYMRPDDETNK